LREILSEQHRKDILKKTTKKAQLSEELGIENSAPRPTRQASSTIAWWQDRQSEIKKKAKKERNQPLVNALKEDSSNVSEETSKQRKWDLGQAFSDLLRKRL